MVHRTGDYGVAIESKSADRHQELSLTMNWERIARRTLLFTSLAVTSVLLGTSHVQGSDNVEKLTHCRDNVERSSENR